MHIVTHEEVGQGRGLPVARGARLGRSRILWGWFIAVCGPALLAIVLSSLDHGPGLANDVLLFLSLTVGAALVGGLLPALASAALCSALLNFYFTPPTRTLTISDPENIVAIVISFAVAVSVASVVDLAARRTHQAARLRAESEILSFLAGSVLRGEDSLDALLARLRETFAMEAVALLERGGDGAPWSCVAAAGQEPPRRPEDAAVEIPGDDLALVLSGRALPAEDRRVLSAFAAQAAVALDRQRLVGQAGEARRLAESERFRTALLAAVSHDLRTPLTGIKASVSSLRSAEVEWSREDRAALLEGIEDGADRLDALIGNLLDMSRLTTGTVVPLLRETGLDEVVPRALAGVPEGSVVLDVPESLPLVTVDRGLLERVVANLVENAVKYSPGDRPVLISMRQSARPGGAARGGPGSRGPRRVEGADLRALPAAGRRAARRRGRPRARGGARVHRGAPGHAHRRGHPRRRADDGPRPPRADAGEASGQRA